MNQVQASNDSPPPPSDPTTEFPGNPNPGKTNNQTTC